MKSFKEATLNLLACVPVSVVLALVLMGLVALMVTGVYFALNFFGG